jgi:hypothetical protein
VGLLQSCIRAVAIICGAVGSDAKGNLTSLDASETRAQVAAGRLLQFIAGTAFPREPTLILCPYLFLCLNVRYIVSINKGC